MLREMKITDLPPGWEYSMELLKDPNRIRILRALSKKPHTFEQLSKATGVEGDEALVYHLSVLRNVELLELKSKYISGSVKKIYSVNQSVAERYLAVTEYIQEHLYSTT